MLLHFTRITDHLAQVQENHGFAVPSGLAIPTLGRGSAKTNLEVAASRRQTSPARKDVVSSSIVATPAPQTGDTGSLSRTGQLRPFASGLTTPLTCASLVRNDGWTTLLSSPARAFETPSRLP